MSQPTPPPASPPTAPMRRLAALWFADLVGYTELSARDEAAALRLVALLQDISRRLVTEHGGRIVKFVGDAVMAEFGSAESAVQSALALDASLRDECRAAGMTAALRTGVHLGELTFAPDGDVYGDGVNIAARLQAEASVGCVLVSEDVWRQLRKRPVFLFTDGGARALKGHPEPLGTWEVVLRYEAPLSGGPAEAPRPEGGDGSRARLIVLPFRILRPDPETDFLSFALADAITASLAGLHSLTVRSSVAGLRWAASDAPDLKALSAQLGVDRVLAGTLLRAGDQVRVTAQLFDASQGTVLWSQTSQAPTGDLFDLQDALTNKIVGSLSEPLTAREQRQLKRDVPASPRAYEFYLRANQLAQSSRTWPAAIDLYKEALAEDPLYAPAWARLGRCHRLAAKYATTAAVADAEMPKAEAAYRRALELNPDLSAAHTQLAQLEAEGGRAADALERLIARTRGAATPDPEMLAALGHALRYGGLLDASAAAHERAAAADPSVRTSAAHTWFMACDYERVAAQINSGVESEGLHEMSLAALGRIDEARARSARMPTEGPMAWFTLSLMAFLAGDRSGLAANASEAVRVFPDAEGLYYMARCWARLGEEDQALELLDRIVGMGYACPDTLARDRYWDDFRDHPRFRAAATRMETMRDRARARFEAAGGPALLGIRPQAGVSQPA